ncbi:MAG: S8 family serine peptidase [Prosthecobacter sp.]|nr:S8 family serine peptidase [Prosthecobacter sp.]
MARAARQVFSRIVLREKPAVPPAEQAFRQSLKPRRIPPKEALRIPEGQQLRLTVKIADELVGRANDDGGLSVQSSSATVVEGLQRLVTAHDLRFRRVQTVSDAQLADLTERAARNSGAAQPDLAADVEVIASENSRAAIIALARELHALPEIEYAELESQDQPPPPPAADVAPVTPLLVSNQTYRGASTGVNVDYVWNTFGVRGDGSLRVTDCEYQYNPDHEDLSGLVQMQPNLVSMYTGFGDDHGTAVVGIIASGWNSYGTTGSMPECVTRFYPEFSTLTTGHQSRSACVTAAIAASASGDIVVLEMQANGPATGTTDYVMAEIDISVWNAVRVGTDAGIITVAAAGNGNQNLDDSALFSAYNARGDSGAIIVGGGSSARAKLSFSTYGTRVNVQGWGGGVFTTGYGAYATYGSDPNQEYTSGFSGTSSATPVVASAVALLQSVAIKLLGIRLSPGELRSILVNTGRPQTGAGAATTPIGPLPELEAAVAALLAAHPPTFSTLESWGHYHLATPTPDLAADVDQDGSPALLEYVLGTDPKTQSAADRSRHPHVSLAAPGGGPSVLALDFHQPATRTAAMWVVQQSDSLLTNSWQDLVHGVNGVTITRTGDTIQVTLPATAQKFLRLKVTAN